MKTRIERLKEEIKKQREINSKLFHSVPIASHEDPRNEKAEPLLQKWRKGSLRLKSLLAELQELEMSIHKQQSDSNYVETFVNGFGEATEREITCSAYQRQQKQLQTDILSYIS